jgi:hypothetical protein
MGKIGPKMKASDLKQSAVQTREGTGLHLPLPGVLSDAKEMDEKAYEANRKLAQRISEAFNELKPSDEHGPRFVLGWRLYSNADNPYWDEAASAHVCGCNCGCFGGPDSKAGGKTMAAKRKAGKKAGPAKKGRARK